MSKQIQVVHLTLIKGAKILKDEDGNIFNESLSYKLIKESIQWKTDLANFKFLGYGRATVNKVVKFVDGKEAGEVSQEVVAEIQSEVNAAFTSVKPTTETPEQKQIKELQAMVKNLMEANDKKHVEANKMEVSLAPKEEKEAEVSGELLEAQKAYFDKFGKNARKNWTVEDIKAKLAE